jgi:glutathione synthase/RimK-type ligase-like ATP-grasp enzyme
MKIAIHNRAGSFSEKWLEYCAAHQVDYKLVNCFESDIISQVDDCVGLMWHWSHDDPRANLFARQLTYALERIGKRVFPDSKTCWHYDDKVGQKYLLEALHAPLAPSYVFYDERTARKWIEDTEFPKVLKLRHGAGSANVFLIESKGQGKKYIHKAFGHGFSPVDRVGMLKERIWHLHRDKNLKALAGIGKGLAQLFIPTSFERDSIREKGYVYFQEFIPDNTYDIRIIVIGKRAFGIKRLVREGDFRASGSGRIVHLKEEIDPSCIRASFEISRDIGSQCLAYDFVFRKGRPLLAEVSYAFIQSGYRECSGFWDEKMAWHEGKFFPEWFMIEDFINSITHPNAPL